jgi:hypothetical protein
VSTELVVRPGVDNAFLALRVPFLPDRRGRKDGYG